MPTMTTAEILMDVLSAFKQRIPALNKMGTDFRVEKLTKGKKYTAHIASLPSIADYDADQGGYKNGATDARTLLADVDVTISNHKHVPLKFTYLNSIQDKKKEYDKVIGGAGSVLAKALIDSILAGFTNGNFSAKTVTPTADFDLDVISAVSGTMNLAGASTEDRVMIVNTLVANVIGADSRISSKDYHGQMTGGSSLRRWSNVGGFSEIIEYPDLPANGQAQTGIAFESRAFAVLAGPPDSSQSELAKALGIIEVMKFETVTDEETGITLGGVSWQEPGTGDLYFSPTLVWGVTHGKAGGANGAVLDKAGHRIGTAADA